MVSIIYKGQNHSRSDQVNLAFNYGESKFLFYVVQELKPASPIKLYWNNFLWHQVIISRINTVKIISVLIIIRVSSCSGQMHSAKTTVSLLVTLWASYFSCYNIQYRVKRVTWFYAHFTSFSTATLWSHHFLSVITCTSNVQDKSTLKTKWRH